MKIYWSTFLSVILLAFLAGCGAEQFGTTPQSENPEINPLQVFQQSSCSGHTLIKPTVDILYVVDNSSSNGWISDNEKRTILNTIGSISSQFDYRVIGTPLLKTTDGNGDYQVLPAPGSPPESLVGIPSSKMITSASQFTFFQQIVTSQAEAGTRRIQEFINSHKSDGLFRQGAYLFVVLVSNGRDTEIESYDAVTGLNAKIQPNYNDRKDSLIGLKNHLASKQFRFFSVTANTKCSPERTGYWGSPESYGSMSRDIYSSNSHPSTNVLASSRARPNDSTPVDANSNSFGHGTINQDHYDLCGSSVSSLFAEVNSTIQQVIVPHTYKYWPITSTDGTIDTTPGKIRVYKSSPNSAPIEMPSNEWSYLPNPGNQNTRILPTVGEPTNRAHLIEFKPNNFVKYPDCISIYTSSNLEYFGYVSIPKRPIETSVVIKINGVQVPASGWSLAAGGSQTINIKVAHNGYPNTPIAMRTGYMLKLTEGYYYQSGDNVEVYYVPAGN